MRNLSLSIKIYIALIITLAVLAAINVFLPQGPFSPILPDQELPASKPVPALVNAVIMLILYGGLGFIISGNLDFWLQSAYIFGLM